MDIFNNLCRACNTEQQHLLNLYTDQQHENSTTIESMLEYCLLMPILKEDMYPELICYFCVKQLEISYRFLKRFKLVQKEFETVYEHMKNELQINNLSENDCNLVKEIEQDLESKSKNDYEKPTQSPVTDESEINATQLNLAVDDLESINTPNTIEVDTKLCQIASTPNSDVLPAETCLICKKIFYTTKALNLHFKISHKKKINAKVDKDVDSYSEMIENLNKHTEEEIVMNCFEINLEHITKNNTHSLQVADQFLHPIGGGQKSEPAESCIICNKTFFTTKALNIHLKLAHKHKITMT